MLDAVIYGDDMARRVLQPAVAAAERPAGPVPAVGLPAGDFPREVHAFQARPGGGGGYCGVDVDPAVRGVDDNAVGRTGVADAPGERACVDAGDADQTAAGEPVIQPARCAEIGRPGRVHAQHEAARGRRIRLHILAIGADIADMRKCEGDDLPGIGRVGQDFLVAGRRGVEADLADRLAPGAEAPAPEHGAIGKDQGGRGAVRSGGLDNHRITSSFAPGNGRRPLTTEVGNT